MAFVGVEQVHRESPRLIRPGGLVHPQLRCSTEGELGPRAPLQGRRRPRGGLHSYFLDVAKRPQRLRLTGAYRFLRCRVADVAERVQDIAEEEWKQRLEEPARIPPGVVRGQRECENEVLVRLPL